MSQHVKKMRPRSNFTGFYSKIRSIDGSHSLWDRVQDIGVPYKVRKRKGAEVAYFNFPLAKEMGLIPQNHPEVLSKELCGALIDTFAIKIINEFDQKQGKRFQSDELKKNNYYATRYLQLQHENKQGRTSGDGRSIWNGQFRGKDATWDITSCGTGATCLSPAAAKSGKFFRTGDPSISYGCGTADLSDGLSAVLMSEIFHHYGYPTERTLAVLSFPGKQSINVRAGKNLIRPAHLFRYLKMGDYDGLQKLLDYFIERQLSNRSWTRATGESLYDTCLRNIAEAFAHSTALFESFYIFCWLDWDGDNILAADAGILDYGSVRQFGLFHKEYRYDDDDRWSTTISEQKIKARYIVQCFAQLIDFAKTKQKKPLQAFKNHKILNEFNDRFEYHKKLFLLKRTGFDQAQAIHLVSQLNMKNYQLAFEDFERAQSKKGVYKVEDGITSNALYCMRDFLREFPKHYMNSERFYSSKEFLDICASNYAIPNDLKLNPKEEGRILELQKEYISILRRAAKLLGCSLKKLLLEITMRSSLINRYDRITGNGIICITDHIMESHKNKDNHKLFKAIKDFIDFHTGTPKKKVFRGTQNLVKKLTGIIEKNRQEI